MRRCLVVLIALVGSLTAPTHAWAGGSPARAAATWSGFADMVVDESAGYVFISGTPTGVLVADLSGTQVGTISVAGTTGGMTLSDDGTTLFVTVSAKHQILAVDAADPLHGAATTHDVGAACPVDVVMSAGLVWFADGCQVQDPVALDYLDPGTDATAQVAVTPVGSAGLSSTPAIPGAVFVSGNADVARYDVTGGASPTATLTATHRTPLGPHLSFVPDGSQVLTDTARFLAAGTLNSQGKIRMGADTKSSATAVRASNGAEAVAAQNLHGNVRDEVRVYDRGATTPFRTYSFPHESLGYASLAFGATDLYIAEMTKAGGFRIHVVDPKPQPSLEVRTDRTFYRYRQRATVTAVLGADATVRRVAVYAQTAGRARHLIRQGKVDAKGRLVAHLRMKRKTTFTAVVAGDATTDGNSASTKVLVGVKMTGRFLHAIGHSGRYALYRQGSTAQLVGRIQPDRGGCLYFELGLKVSGGWTDTASQCFPTKHGRVRVRLPYRPAYGHEPLRIKVWWEGRGDATASSRWYYFEFRR